MCDVPVHALQTSIEQAETQTRIGNKEQAYFLTFKSFPYILMKTVIFVF